jgi:hypothetical protein
VASDRAVLQLERLLEVRAFQRIRQRVELHRLRSGACQA